jgi:peptidoglycan L-alanyl-D-glutamate endopeptidase CwlK
MASRKIEDLVPELQEKYYLFEAKMKEAEIPFMVTCTYRSQQEQNDLYAQGRTKPGKKVTWTLKSKHIDRKAFDIAILKDRKPTWDLKADVNDNDLPDYKEAGRIGQSVGLIWGGSWNSPDYPHFQI